MAKYPPKEKLSVEHFTGCMLGGAVGDALGAPVEFLTLQQIQSRYGQNGITDYVEFENQIGEFTDDTQMSLFTAEALLRAHHRATLKGVGGALNKIAHQSYLRWLHTQNIGVNPENSKNNIVDVKKGWLINQHGLFKRRAPGNTCIAALASGSAGTLTNPINNSKGCGTIMRMAPVGLMIYGNPENAFQTACELSAITHGHPTGYLSAGFFAALISDLAVGIELKKAIDKAIKMLTQRENHNETLKAVQAALFMYESSKSDPGHPTPEALEKLGQGWIAEEALAISLYASLIYENDFEKGVLFSINHSGDSDSTGSITGNILGLIHGIDKIPPKWIHNLKDSALVEQVGKDLHLRIKGNSSEPNDEWWEKYPGF
ncbi:MAG: ADP-ribosylglycohydrolase family protein [Bacteroidales bacterium]|nr:ADP-ribosylglycohydrolase family protein [Bacteroidales bacterium]